MELRNHPLMSFQGVRNWPPEIDIRNSRYPSHGRDWNAPLSTTLCCGPGTCFITMFHDGCYYVGELSFDDHEFCARVCELLKANFGRSEHRARPCHCPRSDAKCAGAGRAFRS
jgi:hypothetical protein